MIFRYFNDRVSTIKVKYRDTSGETTVRDVEPMKSIEFEIPEGAGALFVKTWEDMILFAFTEM